MKKMKHALLFMGMGAVVAIVAMKMINCSECSVDDLMEKEKRMFKNLKKKIMN